MVIGFDNYCLLNNSIHNYFVSNNLIHDDTIIFQNNLFLLSLELVQLPVLNRVSIEQRIWFPEIADGRTDTCLLPFTSSEDRHITIRVPLITWSQSPFNITVVMSASTLQCGRPYVYTFLKTLDTFGCQTYHACTVIRYPLESTCQFICDCECCEAVFIKMENVAYKPVVTTWEICEIINAPL